MNISQTALAELYIYALILGGLLAAVYDLLRITRIFLGVRYSRCGLKRLQTMKLPLLKPYRRKSESRALGIVVFFEDLLFCIIAAIALILLFYQENNGKFRFPALLAAGTGFLIYRGTLGRLCMLSSEVIAFFIEITVRYVFYFVTLPIRFVAKVIRKRAKAVAERFVRAQKRARRKHHTQEQWMRLQQDACGLVPPHAKEKTRRPKRGKYVAKGKETVQSHASGESFIGTSRHRVDRRLRQ